MTSTPPQDRPALPEWVALTDDDRDRAFQTLPDMLDGFMKKWGWLHFAKAIEDICREKNEARTAAKDAEIARLQGLYDVSVQALIELTDSNNERAKRVAEMEALLSRAMFAMEEWQIAHTLRGEILGALHSYLNAASNAAPAALPPTQGGAG
ncbi:MAG: hypothetical protein V4757_07410 [Pseudomonadota bacterium]